MASYGLSLVLPRLATVLGEPCGTSEKSVKSSAAWRHTSMGMPISTAILARRPSRRFGLQARNSVSVTLTSVTRALPPPDVGTPSRRGVVAPAFPGAVATPPTGFTRLADNFLVLGLH